MADDLDARAEAFLDEVLATPAEACECGDPDRGEPERLRWWRDAG